MKSCCCCIGAILLTTIAIFGVIQFFLWLAFGSHRVKLQLADVTLSQFNLTTHNNLQYNLTLTISIRNPNRNIGLYYDRINASAFYQNEMLASVMLTPFYQSQKNTSYLRPVFEAQSSMVLDDKQVSAFNEEKNKGVYSIGVKIYLVIRYKHGSIKIGNYKPMIDCELKVPLFGGNNTGQCRAKF